jgi:hypothetical protein
VQGGVGLLRDQGLQHLRRVAESRRRVVRLSLRIAIYYLFTHTRTYTPI